MKKIVTLIFMVMVVLAGCSSTDEAGAFPQLNDGTLTVGMECDYAPYNWTTTEEFASEHAMLIDGSSSAFCDGYDVKIAQELATKLGVELVIKKVAWDGLPPALMSGQIDVIIAGMSPTEERKQTMSFTEQYFKEEPIQTVVVRADSPYAGITNIDDLENAIITAQLGTLQISLIDQIPNVGSTNPLPDYNSLIQATNSGAIDGYIAERVVAEKQTIGNSELVMLDLVDKTFVLAESDTTTSIAVKKDSDEFIAELNSLLSEISEETRQTWMSDALDSSNK